MISRSPRPFSRREVALGLGASALATACKGQAGARAADPAPRPPRATRTLAALGVDRFSSRDQWRALTAATEAAAEGGFDLIGDPDANYRHDGLLTLDGVSFDGQGCTLTALSDGPQAVHCLGDGFRLANLRVLGAARTRAPDNTGNGIWIGDDNRTATGFTIENVTADRAAPGRGFAGTGFMFNNAHRGRIVRATARRTLSDGIHITNGSSDLAFDRPLSEYTGDDGFAVVSYVPQKQLCSRITVTDGISRDSLARGFTVSGGRDISFTRIRAERPSAAGLFLYSEEHWNTYGVVGVRVLDPVLVDCSTGRDLPAGFQNGALIVGGREGADVIAGETVQRGVSGCVIRNPVITGAGPACSAAISLHRFARAPRITGARLNGIVSSNAALPPAGIEIGGYDVVIEEPRLTNIAGIAILVTKTASGRCRITGPRVDGSRTKPGAINSFVFVDAAPALDKVEISDGVFAHGPDRLAIVAVPRQLQLVRSQRR